MKTTALSLLFLSLLGALCVVPASAEVQARHKDIVATAASDARFSVLATALKQAGLLDTLRGEGPFTVFAPTDDAFAKLPQGAVAALLEPSRKADLQHVLTAHVVSGRVLSSQLAPAGAVKTLSGSTFPVGLRIGKANVIKADILCSNGVIHVIDTVLIPEAPTRKATPKPLAEVKPKEPAPNAMEVIHGAIDRGVPVFNDGDVQGCADIYEKAAQRLVDAGTESVSDLALVDMKRTLLTASKDPRAYAWALRESFDRYLEDAEFEPLLEAALPEGFPQPGPVGTVVKKRYPAYRAARASQSRENGAFWRLFQHIKSNKVEMTAPVEMTMDADMRMKDMAFLYEAPDQGQAGRQGSVDVLDLDSIEVLSIGMRGMRNESRVQLAKSLVEARMKSMGLRPAGDWRLMGYNSPMVATAKRFWELQIPVARR